MAQKNNGRIVINVRHFYIEFLNSDECISHVDTFVVEKAQRILPKVDFSLLRGGN